MCICKIRKYLEILKITRNVKWSRLYGNVRTSVFVFFYYPARPVTSSLSFQNIRWSLRFPLGRKREKEKRKRWRYYIYIEREKERKRERERVCVRERESVREREKEKQTEREREKERERKREREREKRRKEEKGKKDELAIFSFWVSELFSPFSILFLLFLTALQFRWKTERNHLYDVIATSTFQWLSTTVRAYSYSALYRQLVWSSHK